MDRSPSETGLRTGTHPALRRAALLHRNTGKRRLSSSLLIQAKPKTIDPRSIPRCNRRAITAAKPSYA
jgi:hypothetical protein